MENLPPIESPPSTRIQNPSTHQPFSSEKCMHGQATALQRHDNQFRKEHGCSWRAQVQGKIFHCPHLHYDVYPQLLKPLYQHGFDYHSHHISRHPVAHPPSVLDEIHQTHQQHQVGSLVWRNSHAHASNPLALLLFPWEIINHVANFATNFGKVNVASKNCPISELNIQPLVRTITTSWEHLRITSSCTSLLGHPSWPRDIPVKLTLWTIGTRLICVTTLALMLFLKPTIWEPNPPTNANPLPLLLVTRHPVLLQEISVTPIPKGGAKPPPVQFHKNSSRWWPTTPQNVLSRTWACSGYTTHKSGWVRSSFETCLIGSAFISVAGEGNVRENGIPLAFSSSWFSWGSQTWDNQTHQQPFHGKENWLV